MEKLVLGGMCLMGGLFALMFSFYLLLCFICWVGDVIEKRKGRYKK